jgi:GST-like protein
MSIVFYEAPMSSATPVACALAELEVPHERVRFDLAAGDQKKPEFLRLNPNGKVPTLVVDGTPMFEALAILLWLGDRYGVGKGLWPAPDSPARLEALSWSAWAYVSFGSAVYRLLYAASPRVDEALRSPAQAAEARKDLGQLLDVLEARLAQRGHLLGDGFSLADLIVGSVIGYGRAVGVDLGGRKAVEAWLAERHGRAAGGGHTALSRAGRPPHRCRRFLSRTAIKMSEKAASRTR